MKNLKKTRLHNYFLFLTLIAIALIITFFADPVGATNVSEDLSYYEIKLSATPLNGGVLSGDGVYEEGTEINLVAEASDGYYFSGWIENDEIISTDSKLSLTVTENRDLIAVFKIYITIHDNNDSDITLNYVSGEHSYTTLGPITTYTQYLQRLYGHGQGRITQYPKTGHMAIDSVNDGPTPHKVYALSGGVIQSMGTDSYGGLYIYVRVPELNNNRFLYLHFASRNPSLYVGQTIKTGHYLGIEGSTGYATGRHTHFAVIHPTNWQIELEPWYWLNRIPDDGGYPPPTGSIRVTIEPSEVRSAGAQWRLTSGPDTGWKNSGSTISNLPVGSYTITYKDITGWNKPANVSVSVSSNQTTSRTGTYNIKNYTLYVRSTNPTSGVTITSSTGHGGTTGDNEYQISVAHGTSYNLTAPQYVGNGNLRKSFQKWDGTHPSNNRTVSGIMDGGRLFKAIYVDDPEPSGSVKITIEPSEVRSAGAQWRLTSGPDTGWQDSGATITSLPVGSYTITFKEIADWVKPSNLTVNITTGTAETRTVAYSFTGQSFSDVSPTHIFYKEIEAVAAAGITAGYPDGTFRPSNPVTRMAMAAFLVRGLELDQAYSTPAQPTFTDVPLTHPFYVEIEILAASGISEGYNDGTFRPSAEVTRMAMAAFLVRGLALDQSYNVPAQPTFSDVPSTHPFYVEIEILAASGISEGYDDGTFRPSAIVTRMAMAAFLYRALGMDWFDLF